MSRRISNETLELTSLFRLFLPIWIVTVLAFSFLPGDKKLAIGTTTTTRVYANAETDDLPHRALHIVVFGLTELFAALAARNYFQSGIGFVATLSFGALIEIVQHLVFGSVFEWWDIRDDATGVLIAFSLFWIVRFSRTC